MRWPEPSTNAASQTNALSGSELTSCKPRRMHALMLRNDSSAHLAATAYCGILCGIYGSRFHCMSKLGRCMHTCLCPHPMRQDMGDNKGQKVSHGTSVARMASRLPEAQALNSWRKQQCPHNADRASENLLQRSLHCTVPGQRRRRATEATEVHSDNSGASRPP